MEVKRKPDHAPEWVWEEFQACQDPMADPLYQECTDVFSRMISSRDMERVWKSLEARESLIGPFPKAATLASVVFYSIEEFGGSERLTGNARKEISRRLESSAREFIKCLDDLKNGAGYDPDFISDRLGVRFEELIGELQIKYSYKAFSRLEEKYGESADFNDGVILGIELTEALPRILDAFVNASQEWASEKPVISRPENENAPRLYLIRYITRMFRHWYGNPLRANTLAVASVFFNCDGLTEADITKLAP